MLVKSNKTIYKIFLVILFLAFSLLFITSLSVEAEEGNLIDLNLKGVDIRDALRTIAELAEVNLVIDESVQGQLTIRLENLSFEEAVRLIVESKGLDYIYLEETVVVATPERIKKLYRPDKIFRYKLKHRQASEINKILISLFPDLSIQKEEISNNIIVRGDRESFEKVNKLVNILDQPVTDTKDIKKEYKFISLKKNNLEEIKESILSVYPDLTVRVNHRLKNIMLYGKKKNIKKAENLINKAIKFDKIIQREVKIAYNKYDEINSILVESGLNLEVNYRPNFVQLTGEKDEVNRALYILKDYQNKINKPVKSSLYQINYLKPEEIGSLLQKTFPEEQIIINSSRGQLLIRGDKKRVDEIISLAKEIDTPRKQVIIEARIEEISRTKLTDIGISPNILSSINVIDIDKNNNGPKVVWPELLKALKDEGKAKTLAHPRLMALNGEKASLLIGDEIPVKIEKKKEGELVNETEYIEAGISLEFSPWITDNNEIIIEINPSVSSLGETLVDSLPTINTREVKTRVRLRDGETFAIGGLIQDDTISSLSSIPYLSEIPILGRIFNRNKINNIKTEILIFITPKIVDVASREENYYKDAGYPESNIESYKLRQKRVTEYLKDPIGIKVIN